MRISYRTRMTIRRVGTVVLFLLLVAIIAWFCSVVWLERYVVYSREGAELDFELPTQTLGGVVAKPPAAKNSINIYYNEGTDAIGFGREMSKLDGYYIDYNALSKNINGVMEDLKHVPAGTPIMIELKGDYGTLYYSSNVSGAALSQSVSITTVDEIIRDLRNRGFYTIARISAFRDYDFGNKNVPSGLYMKSRAGLWMDSGGYFWLNPTSPTTLGWITALTMELKNMGFNEVLLANFRFPAETDKYIFDGDMDEAIAKAAKTLTDSCSSDNFVLSFGVPSTTFPLPEGRTRMYLEKIDAKDVSTYMSQATIENADVRVVFISETNDTRYNNYSVLHPLASAEVLEAQKADLAAQAEAMEENQ